MEINEQLATSEQLENTPSTVKSQTNPFSLFLILILLINSFEVTSRIFKERLKKADTEEG